MNKKRPIPEPALHQVARLIVTLPEHKRLVMVLADALAMPVF